PGRRRCRRRGKGAGCPPRPPLPGALRAVSQNVNLVSRIQDPGPSMRDSCSRFPDMTPDQAGKPEAMRAALRGYVASLHHAYLGVAALLPPGERAALPLLRAGQVTVIVAAARHL